MEEIERVEAVVIGGGQAGLSAGYHLKQRGISFVILDANERLGDSWRQRWDSLRLFTPAGYDGLDGMPFPAAARDFPSKEAMAEYLERYAAEFALPVRLAARVNLLTRARGHFLAHAGDDCVEADNVIVAMGNYQRPVVPRFAADLDRRIVQFHSSAYRNPSQVGEGAVLVVGAGNSGAEIAKELTRSRLVLLSGRDVGQVPFRSESFLGGRLLVHLMRWVGHHVLTTSTPMGRKARPALLERATPLIRVKAEDLLAAGVQRVPRVSGVRNGQPQLENGAPLPPIGTVIWCTGYEPGFSWIDLPVLDGEGRPVHERGVALDEPGCFFLGQHFQYAMTSGMVNGVGRDAAYIADRILERVRAAGGVPADRGVPELAGR